MHNRCDIYRILVKTRYANGVRNGEEERTCEEEKKIQMFVSYQTTEKFNVEMDEPPQCSGRLNANIWLSPMLVSVRTVIHTTS